MVRLEWLTHKVEILSESSTEYFRYISIAQEHNMLRKRRGRNIKKKGRKQDQDHLQLKTNTWPNDKDKSNWATILRFSTIATMKVIQESSIRKM